MAAEAADGFGAGMGGSVGPSGRAGLGRVFGEVRVRGKAGGSRAEALCTREGRAGPRGRGVWGCGGRCVSARRDA